MQSAKEVSSKDFLIYDADCGFCEMNINRFKKLIGDKIDYIPNNKIETGFYGIDLNQEGSSIKFFEHQEKRPALNDYEKVKTYDNHEVFEDAVLYHGAYAVFKALSKKPSLSLPLFLYKYFPFFGLFADAVYRIVARNRQNISNAMGLSQCTIQKNHTN